MFSFGDLCLNRNLQLIIHPNELDIAMCYHTMGPSESNNNFANFHNEWRELSKLEESFEIQSVHPLHTEIYN
jgi:hypothetical protein